MKEFAEFTLKPDELRALLLRASRLLCLQDLRPRISKPQLERAVVGKGPF